MLPKAFGSAAIALVFLPLAGVNAEVGHPTEIAPGVWFHEGDLGRRGHCNTGWIVVGDYLVVVDANFPSGAREVLPRIREGSDRPVRFTVDTHHHGDHAYGNQVWVQAGATIVAHEGALAEMQRTETGQLFGGPPGAWESLAAQREDVAGSRLAPPTLVFPRSLTFTDGRRRVELHHLGIAHTRGDTFVWLPEERVLFTGDACVNGPYNYMGDGDTGEWVRTLEAARSLSPRQVCPGHGLAGGPEMLDHQLEFLRSLREAVSQLVRAGKAPAEVKASVDSLRQSLRANERIAPYLGGMFPSQVEKVYVELGGRPFESALKLEPETWRALRERRRPEVDFFAGFPQER